MKADEPSGFLLLRKEEGITSFQSLHWVKKALSTGKVGHTGTLDKFAAGLLLVLAGRAVKLTPWFSGCDKWYEGIVRFGEETDTLDPEGRVIARGEVPARDALEAALPRFRGTIAQTPPAYSAVRIGGERASRLARSGVAVEMKERAVSIYALELLSYEPPLASIRVHCSKGTYIRSLARDIALEAGSRAHLVSLERTGSALFRLEDAVAPENLDIGALKPISSGIFRALGLAVVEADGETAAELARGRALAPLLGRLRFPGGAEFPAPERTGDAVNAINAVNTVGVFDKNAGFLAVLTRENGRWVYGYVYARN
ncbi:MAG: tRNA pseudouridine(55) synthase TruB [Spirochaetaceae bacterium]|jgi:tRNA pseudouridine55 synthase|nr:tRNA pseudouridine(55) synthase TruB [Spirochaetaceae bacterium]